jgi:CheY-like chemotaxis protein
MAPARPASYSPRSALVIEPIPAQHSVVVATLKGLGVAEVYSAANESAAMRILTDHAPAAIFAEFSAPGWHAPTFVAKLRRSTLPAHKNPVIMMSGAWTAKTILEARDCGAHECIRKPFSIADLARRIRAAMDMPRDWIAAERYVGPDRRRFNSGGGEGLERRSRGQAKPA